MATIQIRELPEDAYAVIRARAQAAGQSIQAYMRDQIIELARRRTQADAWATVETALAEGDAPGASLDSIIEDLTRDRR